MRVLIQAERSGGGWDVTVTGPGLDRRGRMDMLDDFSAAAREDYLAGGLPVVARP